MKRRSGNVLPKRIHFWEVFDGRVLRKFPELNVSLIEHEEPGYSTNTQFVDLILVLQIF